MNLLHDQPEKLSFALRRAGSYPSARTRELEPPVILEVKHLRLVEAIATYGSITNAGKHLHLTQSALSHQLNDLERRLETPLFHRVGRRLVPTPAGDRVLQTALRTLAILRKTESSIRRMATGQDAVLRFATECYTAYHWLPPLLEEYSRRCPAVEVQLVAEATRKPVDALLAGKIDLGIMCDPAHDDRIETTPLFEDELVAVAPVGHVFAGKPFVVAEDFAGEHVFTYSATRSSLTLFKEVLDPAGVVPRRHSAIQLTEAIVEMVKAGQGVSVLARWAAEPYVLNGTLAAVRLTEAGIRRQWSAATLRQQSTPLHVHEFCRLLSQGPFRSSGVKRAEREQSRSRSVGRRRAT
jgi:LysR family transcriptional regulator for metE and metH